MNDDGYSIHDLTGLIRRRTSLVVITFLALTLGSVIVAYSLDNLYRSAATIVIEQPEVSDRFLPGTNIEIDREQRILRIYDEIMTRDNLAQIVSDHDLYTELRNNGAPESVVYELRRNVELEFLQAQDDPRIRFAGDVTGFVLSYYHSDNVKARDVTRDIVDLFQLGNRQRRQVAYDETTAALSREADNLRDQVAHSEAELAEFKAKHPGALPEDRDYNRQIIERKARDLDGLDREIRSLQERKTLLQSQLAQTDMWVTAVGPDGQPLPASNERLQTLQGEYLQMLGNKSVTHPDVQRARREIEALSGGVASPAFRQAVVSTLQLQRVELVEARIEYGPNYPDVQNLERAVAALEKQVAAMPIVMEEMPAPTNPVYINVQLQLDGVNTEIAALRQDRFGLQSEIMDIEAKVQVAPEVEREWLELTRDLGLARNQYEDIRTRQMSVQRAGVLEEEELSERYVVTRRPSLTYTPAFPNRSLFMIVGLFLGITFSIGAAIIAEALDGTIRSTRDIRIIMDMPPIAAIPAIATTEDVAKARSSRLMSFFAISVAITVVVAYALIQRGSI
jgi:succinoglycan biosynthesis transport protein ExoP